MKLFDIVTEIGKILLIINVLSIVSINVWYYIYRKKHVSKTMILLMALLLGTLSIELSTEYLADRKLPNLHLTHYYTIGLFLLLSIIYYRELKKFQLVVPIGVVLFSGILIYQLLASKIIYDKFNTAGFIVAACVMMTYAFFYYIEHITKKKYWDTYNVGLFLYLGGSSVIFLTINSWEDFGASYIHVWTLNSSLVVLYQAFILMTIYRFHRFQKNQDGISSI